MRVPLNLALLFLRAPQRLLLARMSALPKSMTTEALLRPPYLHSLSPLVAKRLP